MNNNKSKNLMLV